LTYVLKPDRVSIVMEKPIFNTVEALMNHKNFTKKMICLLERTQSALALGVSSGSSIDYEPREVVFLELGQEIDEILLELKEKK
jgi:hypothetical protein